MRSFLFEKILRWPMLGCLFGLCYSAQAQDTIVDKGLEAAIRSYEQFSTHRQPLLFIQLDKDIYNPGESISFSSIAVDAGPDSVAPTSVHVELIDPANGINVASDQFEMMLSRFSAGSLEIPDTLAEGQYLLVAYTNAMVHRSKMEPFKKVISVRAATKDFFRISNTWITRNPNHPDSLYWHARITTDSNGLASRGWFEYLVRGDGKIVQLGKGLIDPFGEVELPLAAGDSVINNLTIAARITRGLKSTKLSKLIDLTPQRINVSYFPESGYLVDGLLSRLIVSLHQNNGKAIHCSGSLYADSSEISTFQTDLYGFASVPCFPEAGKKYWIRLDQQQPETYLSGTFPAIRQTGLVLTVGSATVRDSLLFQIQSRQRGGQYRLLIFSASKMIYAAILPLKKDFRLVKMSTAGWPTGIARVVILSEENEPVAERTIYIAPRALSVKIETDSQEYHQRSKVQVHIRVTTENGDPVRGIFSFSSSMAARIRASNLPDITQPALFTPLQKKEDPFVPPGGYLKDDDALDKVLISKLGDYLQWEEIVNDTVRWLSPTSSDNYGYVHRKDRRLKKPVGISIFGQKVYTIYTDSAGVFEIPDSLLITNFGVDPGAVVSEVDRADQGDYQLYLLNRSETITRKLATICRIPTTLLAGNELEVPEERNIAFERAKTLATATVTARQDEDEQISSSGECLDYVCIRNILNCRNPEHKVGRKPVVGGVYTYVKPDGFTDRKFVYKHCMSCRKCTVEHVQGFLATVPGIHRPGEFFNMDSLKFDPQRPAVYTTLFWQQFVVTNEKGEADFYFYTNDVKGRFYNRLNGWSLAGNFKGQSVFTVAPN